MPSRACRWRPPARVPEVRDGPFASGPGACRARRLHAGIIALVCMALLQSTGVGAQTASGSSLTDDGPQWPVRKPGLWQLTLQTAGAGPQVARHCIDARTDRAMQQMAEGTDAQTCSSRNYRRDGDRFLGESECRFGTSVARVRSSVEGDFTRSYRGEIDSRIEPPTAGLNQMKVTLSARWLGACPAGWKPGDMDVPGMGRVNIADVQAARRLSAPSAGR